MKNEKHHWDKDDFKIYVLLLCAKADKVAGKPELDLIKSLTSVQAFNRSYTEFSKDDENVSVTKIRNFIQSHEYSYWELSKLRNEIQTVFTSDGSLVNTERDLGKYLDSILY